METIEVDGGDGARGVRGGIAVSPPLSLWMHCCSET